MTCDRYKYENSRQRILYENAPLYVQVHRMEMRVEYFLENTRSIDLLYINFIMSILIESNCELSEFIYLMIVHNYNYNSGNNKKTEIVLRRTHKYGNISVYNMADDYKDIDKIINFSYIDCKLDLKKSIKRYNTGDCNMKIWMLDLGDVVYHNGMCILTNR